MRPDLQCIQGSVGIPVVTATEHQTMQVLGPEALAFVQSCSLYAIAGHQGLP